MKKFYSSIAAMAICFTALSQQQIPVPGASLSSKSFNDNWLNAAQQFISASEYHFKKANNNAEGYYTSNRKQGIGFIVNKLGYMVSPIQFSSKAPSSPDWKTGLTFSKIKKGKQFLDAGNEPSVILNKSGLNFNFSGFTIEYANDINGMRQNFIVSKKLPGNGQLEVLLKIQGNLSASVSNNTLALKDKKGVSHLYYQDLNVWDADHKHLNATMEIRDNDLLAIVVNDQNATYPVTIDPINQSPAWTTSADGILPGLVNQLAIDAAYGFSVAGLGDVNADGYDDVAVGTPAMVDLISGTGTLASVGAVFVYFGCAGGLPVTPNTVLQPSTLVAGALFGYNISGGDINKDGKADIIVGAPLDNVTISTGGSGTASGQVGKVYVFDGATLSTPAINFVTLQLSGSGILENGINLSVKALFGFSTAVTEDLNNDGKKDIIVGAPAYAGIATGLLGVHLLDVQSGGAFVFLTNASDDGFTVQKLAPIKTSILGLGILTTNISGLLFGYSVDGVGDYNGDGKPDVIATAPAGIDASSITGLLNGKVLQGSATVYYGTGAGVNVNPGATLTATSGGLLSNLTGSIGNVANLFGLSVKGVKNANGTRNGNILVGAPLGGTLINVLSLQLKTGTVNVFKKQASSPSGYIAPDQVLSSPRNDNNILGLIQANLLYGYSLNNIFDINCDGVGDIIVGEPASSGVQLLNANVGGGAAYVYLGKANGTYQPAPSWTLTAYEDAFLGANATSLIGYSVAGAGKVKGINSPNSILVGSPSRTLDFGSGLLNLGNTLGTMFSLVAGNNGAGKAYAFDINFCSLPVTLTGLRGRYANGVACLSWETAQEINNNHFEIEKSDDAIHFTAIGEVAGKGNSNVKVNYNFNDVNVTKSNNFYRLRSIDNSGRSTYSNTIFLGMNTRDNIDVSFYPNPVTERLTVTVSGLINEAASVKIFDNSGRLLINQPCDIHPGVNKIVIENMNKLSAGVYTARIFLNNMVFSERIIK